MKKDIRHLGLDVDTEKIAVAVAESSGEMRSLGTIAIPHREESVRRLVKKLGPASRLRVCYEAGPHGYGLYWLLSGMGVHCDVVAPPLPGSAVRSRVDRRQDGVRGVVPSRPLGRGGEGPVLIRASAWSIALSKASG
jgi:hypothetical protein